MSGSRAERLAPRHAPVKRKRFNDGLVLLLMAPACDVKRLPGTTHMALADVCEDE